MSPPELVSIVLPAYNLEGRIGATVRAVAEAIPGAEIIVVDDGSRDQTSAEASRAAARVENATVLRHDSNRGKGAALLTGAGAARGDPVVFLDADLDLPPEQVPGLLDLFAEQGCDVLVGTKHHEMAGGRYPWKRRVLSRLFAFVTRVLFRLPVPETQTGLKIFGAGVLAHVLPGLRIHRYAFDLELLVRAHRSGYRIVAAPVDLRIGASSAPLRISTLWEMARDTARIYWWSLRQDR